MSVSENVILGETNGRPIIADVHRASESNAPVVIFCHGFKGFKDWGYYPQVAEQFKQKGFHFIRFNFSHNGGTLEQPIDFPDLESFGRNTFSKELDDLRQVIAYAKSEFSGSEINLLTHSRGTATAILSLTEFPQINKLCSWAGVSSIAGRFKNIDIDQWRKNGVIHIKNGRTGQQMPLYIDLLDDYLANELRYRMEDRLREFKGSYLCIHAKDDSVVLLEEAESLVSWAKNGQLYLLESGGHTFGASHPAVLTEEVPKELVQACEQTMHFFSRI